MRTNHITLQVRLTSEEKEILQREARKLGLTMTSLIRLWINKDLIRGYDSTVR